MSRFEVFVGSIPIGHTELELGDPPMGVALGKFLPSPEYANLQPSIVAAGVGSQAHLSLRVCRSNGQELPAEGGVQILDCSAEMGADGLEVHVLGIGYPLYGELFPHHVAAYDAQFTKAG